MKLYEIIDPAHITYAKKVKNPGDLQTINQDNTEAQYRVGKVVFDNVNGLGATPNNKEISYFGFTVIMQISVFLQLAASHGGKRDESAGDINELLQQGYGIATPMLYLSMKDFGEDTISATVTGHEGRARVICCQKFYGLTEVPVHIMPTGLRAKHMTQKVIDQLNENGIQGEDPPHKLVKKPFESIV